MTKKLEGKVAVVTGGNNGIGEATGKVLAREGARVALLARRQDKGQAVQDEIREAGGDATFITCDVSDHESVEAAIAQTVETYEGIHILVNNAGGGALGGKAGEPMRLEDNKTWDRVIGVNLTGSFYVTRAVWPHMAAAGGGAITNISSGAAGSGFTEKMLEIRGGFDVSSYAAAKAGLEGFTRVTASMGGPENIRVNAIRPRLIVNKDGHHWLEHVREYVQILEGKVEAEDIANTVLFLSSEDARYINAAILEVGGGSVSNLG
jgi:NAD(P)-dependent dehydrogenase (short-subunit alcohol dehydrogenase family)